MVLSGQGWKERRAQMPAGLRGARVPRVGSPGLKCLGSELWLPGAVGQESLVSGAWLPPLGHQGQKPEPHFCAPPALSAKFAPPGAPDARADLRASGAGVGMGDSGQDSGFPRREGAMALGLGSSYPAWKCYTLSGLHSGLSSPAGQSRLQYVLTEPEGTMPSYFLV